MCSDSLPHCGYARCVYGVIVHVDFHLRRLTVTLGVVKEQITLQNEHVCANQSSVKSLCFDGSLTLKILTKARKY